MIYVHNACQSLINISPSIEDSNCLSLVCVRKIWIYEIFGQMGVKYDFVELRNGALSSISDADWLLTSLCAGQTRQNVCIFSCKNNRGYKSRSSPAKHDLTYSYMCAYYMYKSM